MKPPWFPVCKSPFTHKPRQERASLSVLGQIGCGEIARVSQGRIAFSLCRRTTNPRLIDSLYRSPNVYVLSQAKADKGILEREGLDRMWCVYQDRSERIAFSPCRRAILPAVLLSPRILVPLTNQCLQRLHSFPCQSSCADAADGADNEFAYFLVLQSEWYPRARTNSRRMVVFPFKASPSVVSELSRHKDPMGFDLLVRAFSSRSHSVGLLKEKKRTPFP